MDEKTDNILTRIQYVVMAMISLIVLFENFSNPWPIIILTGLFSLSFTYRNAILLEKEEKKYLVGLSLFFDIVIVITLNMIDNGLISLLLYFLLAYNASLFLSFRASTWLTVFILFLQNFIYIKKGGFLPVKDILSVTLISICIYLILHFSIYAVRYQITKKQQLSETMIELRIKSWQLENAYIKLKDTADDLEEIAVLRERNRIAQDIHDTVGHTLTTVLLEMEAAERLVTKDSERALEKIKFSKEQIRKGLQDVRQSVHSLKPDREVLNFTQSVKLLINETTRNGSIFIHSYISELPKLSEVQEKIIYQSIQEGISNGIRHGNSTAFVLQLKYEDDYVKLILSDNGKGTDKIEPGFGLGAMEERVKTAGGTFSVSSQAGEGFSIKISIPHKKELSA